MRTPVAARRQRLVRLCCVLAVLVTLSVLAGCGDDSWDESDSPCNGIVDHGVLRAPAPA